MEFFYTFGVDIIDSAVVLFYSGDINAKRNQINILSACASHNRCISLHTQKGGSIFA